ncbi:MAG TPA: hypothetical protein VID48_15305 [Solirubrobacteraceae bacterium]|jgi:hypothetical protein
MQESPQTAEQHAGERQPPTEQLDVWLEDAEELPRRPRRRLLAPIPIALTMLLVTVCGFIAGVLVEKGQASSSSQTGATGLAGRFAALRGGRSGSGGTSAGGAAAGGFAGAAGGGTTVGQVSFLRNGTLYVSTAEGNTVKVTTSAGSTVTKTVKATVASIHPGETVLVTGTPQGNGAISAESIRVGAGAGGLGSLLGAAGGFARRGAGGTSPTGSAGGPALFGSGE